MGLWSIWIITSTSRPSSGSAIRKSASCKFRVSLNVSPVHFEQPHTFVQKIQDLIDTYKIDPSLLTFEITESTYVNNPLAVNQVIRSLQNRNIQISMDDFGSGYSSLNILCSLEIDELKLDRAFLMEMPGHKKWQQQIVMEQIAQLAKKMNMTTVAEGVETWEDEAFILKAGCDYGAGVLLTANLFVPLNLTEKYM